MTRALIATVLILGTLAGCGRVAESRLNPFNWFGNSRSTATLEPESGYAIAEADRRRMVDQVTELQIERTPGGAIIRATGLPVEQGYYDGELVSLSDGEPVNGVLEYHFRIRPPLTPTRVSTVRSREVVVGLFISNQKLAEVREIRVIAQRNTRAVRR
ncbi:MAG: hypothetical protein GW905_12030 [Rhodobacterales bacterium]|nr:hypothetical protein [Rhodobacterales bacterium]